MATLRQAQAKEIKEGDELLIRALVTRVWPDGMVTVHLRGAGQRLTLPGDSDDIAEVMKEKPLPPLRKRDRLI